MDIKVQRNAFGRQVDSFETDLEIDELMKTTGTEHAYHAVFIRAPLIESVHGNAKILSALEDGRIIAAQEGHLLATSFFHTIRDCFVWENTLLAMTIR